MIQLAIAFFLLQPVFAQMPPHLDLDASSKELLSHLSNTMVHQQESAELQEVLDVGLRNLDWLKHMNQFQEVPLQFTKPGSLKGIPITKPKSYSETMVIQNLKTLYVELPEVYQKVLFERQSFTNAPPEPVEQYLELGRKIDVIYQTALRWVMMRPYLDYLKERRRQDIRGYYFLNQIENLDQQLLGFEQLSREHQLNLKNWLLMTCLNSFEFEEVRCLAEWEIVQNQPQGILNYKNRFWPAAKDQYAFFFELQNARDDVQWLSAREARVKIRQDQTQEQQDFLRTNLEDEFAWHGWQMKVDFIPSARTVVEWLSGVTPHVNRLGGDRLTMNLDAPLTEWDTQWTVRHEYGHVLGLPDCYVEFYSPQEEAIVSYQIDVEDLMCSRAGKINQRIFDTLKQAYKN